MRRQIDNSLLEMALVGYSAKRDEVVQKMADIERQLRGHAPAPATAPNSAAKPKRKMSAAGRRAIAEAQRKRWAASRKTTQPPAQTASKGPKPKRKLSRAGRAAIVAALKRRWAAKKAAARPGPAAAKNAAPKRDITA